MSCQTSKPAISVTPVMAPPPIGEAYDELASAVDELGQEQREVLAPDVENLRADIEALPEAQGLDQLGSSIEAILTGVQDIYDEVTDVLRCE